MSHPASAESIFFAALKRDTTEQRAAFLEEACASDTTLRQEVERLLNAYPRMGNFLDQPALPPVAPSDNPITELPGTVIGPYKLLERIGEGGFGVVFLAEQLAPVRRKVALKVLKPGMDTRPVVARFEAERQALALMDHPHIAKVFDGGATPEGRPYFVMELVKGLPITEFCDQNHLNPRQRLELFLSVCQAVQHAHQKGIIHRDLKPSNILVSRHDTTPVVKVIDFGVAKAIGQELTDKTLFTGIAQMVGTPLYMSPEQAGMSDLDVDTRSDIYSLGVLLYELLTGTTPFTRERFQQAGYDEIRRIIREEEPPIPSTRLAQSTETLRSVSAQRQTEPGKLTRLVRGELDWIVMKALEKDRSRRYETANSFALDVQRYLNEEQVLACPPSTWYRFHKFIRRNRSVLAASAVAGVALLIVVVVLAASIGWVVRDRDLRRQLAEQAAEEWLESAWQCCEQGRWPEAAAALRKTEVLLADGENAAQHQRLRELQDDLAMQKTLQEIRLRTARVDVRPLPRQATDTDYAQAFARYGIHVEERSAEEAAARVRARPIWLELVLALDDWVSVRRQARGKKEGSWRRLLAVTREADPDPLRQRIRDALARDDRRALQELASAKGAEQLPAPTAVLLARALRGAGASKEAILLLREIRRRHPGDFWIHHDLAANLHDRKPPRLEEALRFYMAALALRPDSLVTLNDCGVALIGRGNLDEAVACFREVLRLRPDDAEAHHNLGGVLRELGRLDEAETHYQEALRLRPNWALTLFSFANLRMHQKRLDEAMAGYQKAIQVSPDYAPAHCGLGAALAFQGQWDRAIACYKKALQYQEDNADTHYNLGLALRAKRRFTESLRHFRRSHELGAKDPRWPHPSAAQVRQGERLVALQHQLPAILRGEAAATSQDRLLLAELCLLEQRFAAAVRLYRDAFAAEPRLAANLRIPHRFNAACAAARAGCGRSKDADSLDATERAHLRTQARAWLSADLAAWRRHLETRTAQARSEVRQTMEQWRHDDDLAEVREAKRLDQLPEAERGPWRALWTEVNALHRAAGRN